MDKLKKVVIMAGGTGGHVFPGLAVAKQLQQKNIQVEWIGTREGLEAQLVKAANIPLHFISISGLRGKNWREQIRLPFKLLQALFQAMRLLKRLKPDVVLGMGGFVSGPGGIACGFLNIPLIIHEQNAKPGTTNKWLAKIAKKVLEGFPNTFEKRKKVITVGNPVRDEIRQLVPSLNKANTRLHLLVLGGSLGAQAINTQVPDALALMAIDERPLVWHQTGEKHWQVTQSAYQSAGLEANIQPFITDMAGAYAWADVVLCRAGALTVAELCAAGVGAILVPFPYAVDDHQTANAEFMVKNKAAYLIKQTELTPEKLADLLRQFQLNREKCISLAQSAYKSRKIDATEQVCQICEESVL